jgi:hypothetical protein
MIIHSCHRVVTLSSENKEQPAPEPVSGPAHRWLSDAWIICYNTNILKRPAGIANHVSLDSQPLVFSAISWPALALHPIH